MPGAADGHPKESLADLSSYKLAAEIEPTHSSARFIRRMQDSNFREVRQVTNLLLKIKRYDGQMEALERHDENDGSADLQVGIFLEYSTCRPEGRRHRKSRLSKMY